MKPVAIFRHSPSEGPGYFATFLEANLIPWRLNCIDAGDAVPATPDDFSGLAFMGGPMSVNDPLPWISDLCHMISAAVNRNIPVIGHCLGGQLFSKALGGNVTRNPVKEIGWSTVRAENGIDSLRRQWLGELAPDSQELDVFQWHGETFSLPPGAARLLSNSWCENQVAVLGPHLAMQCHIEMTIPMIETWCKTWPDEVRDLDARPSSIQTPEQMLASANCRLPAMRRLADQLYGVWIKGLSRD